MTTPRRYETLNLLPSLAGHRFATAQLGPDCVEQIRSEHVELLAFAATVIGIDVDQLTREDVRVFQLKRGVDGR